MYPIEMKLWFWPMAPLRLCQTEWWAAIDLSSICTMDSQVSAKANERHGGIAYSGFSSSTWAITCFTLQDSCRLNCRGMSVCRCCVPYAHMMAVSTATTWVGHWHCRGDKQPPKNQSPKKPRRQENNDSREGQLTNKMQMALPKFMANAQKACSSVPFLLSFALIYSS